MTQSPPQNFNTSSYGSEETASGGRPVSDTVSEVMDQEQDTARQVSAQAKQGATSRLESQKERAVDSLVMVAQALRQTGQHLNEQDQGTVGTYIEKVAGRVEDFTNHLRANDVTQLLAETQEFARRRPAMFVGAALALGFAGARFLMSSGQRASARSAQTGALNGGTLAGPTGSSAS
jgi:ElaB/YqjD/DUF883 family membrane-anchored ribosome-binding protein